VYTFLRDVFGVDVKFINIICTHKTKQSFSYLYLHDNDNYDDYVDIKFSKKGPILR